MKEVFKRYICRQRPVWFILFAAIIAEGIFRAGMSKEMNFQELCVRALIGVVLVVMLARFAAGFLEEMANVDMKIWKSTPKKTGYPFEYDDIGAIVVMGDGNYGDPVIDLGSGKMKAQILLYARQSKILMDMKWNSRRWMGQAGFPILQEMEFTTTTLLFFMSKTAVGLYVTREIMEIYRNALEDVIELYGDRMLICCEVENSKKSCFLTCAQYFERYGKG